MADGFIKPLGKQSFYRFVDLLGIINIQKDLEDIRIIDELTSGLLGISAIAFLAHSETWDAREIRSAIY